MSRLIALTLVATLPGMGSAQTQIVRVPMAVLGSRPIPGAGSVVTPQQAAAVREYALSRLPGIAGPEFLAAISAADPNSPAGQAILEPLHLARTMIHGPLEPPPAELLEAAATIQKEQANLAYADLESASIWSATDEQDPERQLKQALAVAAIIEPVESVWNQGRALPALRQRRAIAESRLAGIRTADQGARRLAPGPVEENPAPDAVDVPATPAAMTARDARIVAAARLAPSDPSVRPAAASRAAFLPVPMPATVAQYREIMDVLKWASMNRTLLAPSEANLLAAGAVYSRIDRHEFQGRGKRSALQDAVALAEKDYRAAFNRWASAVKAAHLKTRDTAAMLRSAREIEAAWSDFWFMGHLGYGAIRDVQEALDAARRRSVIDEAYAEADAVQPGTRSVESLAPGAQEEPAVSRRTPGPAPAGSVPSAASPARGPARPSPFRAENIAIVVPTALATLGGFALTYQEWAWTMGLSIFAMISGVVSFFSEASKSFNRQAMIALTGWALGSLGALVAAIIHAKTVGEGVGLVPGIFFGMFTALATQNFFMDEWYDTHHDSKFGYLKGALWALVFGAASVVLAAIARLF